MKVTLMIYAIRNLLGKKTFRQWNYSISCARAGLKLTEGGGAQNTLTNIKKKKKTMHVPIYNFLGVDSKQSSNPAAFLFFFLLLN
jgi:hypothetical protein